MLQAVLTASLGEFASKGFTLIETDDHIVILKHEGEIVARYAVSFLYPPIHLIRYDCGEHLAVVHLNKDYRRYDTFSRAG